MSDKRWDDTWCVGKKPAWPEYTNLRIEWFIEECKDLKKRGLEKPVIVEIGAGVGWVTKELCNFFPESPYYCTDISMFALKQIEDLNLANVKTCPISELVKMGHVADIIICGDVIEHVEDRMTFFETITDIIKPDGYLLLTTPNRYLPNLFLNRLLGKEATSQPYDRPFSQKELEDVISNYNFEIIKNFHMKAEDCQPRKYRSILRKIVHKVLLSLLTSYLHIRNFNTDDSIMLSAKYTPS